jgi:uncharacterized protein (TIGR00251 family)
LFMAAPGNESAPFTVRNGSLLLRVKIFPKAGENRIVGERNGELMVRVKAAAVKGKANKELVRFLSKMLDVAGSEIEILSGQSSRHKLITLPTNQIRSDRR